MTVQRTDTGEELKLTCGFLYMCTGYYRYDEGYTPAFAGSEDFGGQMVHPQHWPADLDCRGKRVVVIGSGATAVTLIPSLAEEGAEHVTMLQRSPTYIVPVPAREQLAERLGRWISPRRAYALVRWRNVLLTILIFQLCRRAPRLMRARFRRMAAAELPPGFDIDTHLSPSYNPWDQRVCMAADGDFFGVLRDGRASIVTASIESFTHDGVRLEDGSELAADIIVTATGLRLMMLGGLELEVDGTPVELGSTIAYKGMMLGGVPNLAFAIGYTNASWTLKADLVAEYVCRLLAHMRATGKPICVPLSPSASLGTYPILDLKSGYVLRSVGHALPKQGGHAAVAAAPERHPRHPPAPPRPDRRRDRLPAARLGGRDLPAGNGGLAWRIRPTPPAGASRRGSSRPTGRCGCSCPSTTVATSRTRNGDGSARWRRASSRGPTVASCGTSTVTASCRASARRASTPASGARDS